MSELPQLPLRALAVAPCAACVERRRRVLKFGNSPILVAGLGERSARDRARQRGLDGGSGSVGGIGRGQRPFRSDGSVTGLERDGGGGSAGPGGGEREWDGRCHHLRKTSPPPRLPWAIPGHPPSGHSP